MRLTPAVVLAAPQSNNCIGKRTLVLRDKGIPAIENLAVVDDSFDVLDLSGNAISLLGDGLPRLNRLSCLYLGCNRITKVQSGIAEALPNLQILILTSNRISTRANLNIAQLSRLKKLEIISLIDNPITNDDNELALFLLHHIPTLRFINFHRITDKDRAAVKSKYESQAKRIAENGAEKASKKKRRFDNARS